MNEAIIKLAIEKGGYNGGYRYGSTIDLFTNDRILLDKEFWQALGRALKRDGIVCKHCGDWEYRQDNTCDTCEVSKEDFNGTPWSIYHAHRYLDAHFESPQDEQKFWEGLV